MRKKKIIKNVITVIGILVFSNSIVYASDIYNEILPEKTISSFEESGDSDLRLNEMDKEQIESIIQEMVKAENEQDWIKYAGFWCEDRKEIFLSLFSNKSYIKQKEGITTVEKAEVVDLQELEEEMLPYYVLNDKEYSFYSDKRYYLTAINYTVDKVNKYFYNGVNYCLFILADVNGEWKVISKTEAPIEVLNSLNEMNTMNTERSSDLQTAINIWNARTNGYIVDSNMEVIDTLTDTPNDINLLATSEYATCKDLTTSKVRLLYKGALEIVYMQDYIKEVLSREVVIDDADDEMLKAATIIIKQYTNFHTVYYEKYKDYGCDLMSTSEDQVYNPDPNANNSYIGLNSYYQDKVDRAYLRAGNIHIETQTGKFFLTHYFQNYSYSGNIGVFMDIEEATRMRGTSYEELIRHYYENKKIDSSVNTGVIKFAYYKSTADIRSGWVYIKENNSWYYVDSNGNKVTSWYKINGVWYYFDSDGIMQTGWIEYNGEWYYCKEDGAMVTGRHMIDGRWSLFNSDGVWLGYDD